MPISRIDYCNYLLYVLPADSRRQITASTEFSGKTYFPYFMFSSYDAGASLAPHLIQDFI